MVKVLALLVLVSCATAKPKTEESMRLARITNAHSGGIWEQCPPGQVLLDTSFDVCVDTDGIAWAACAWNNCGRFEDCRLQSNKRILDNACGGDGYRDCPPLR